MTLTIILRPTFKVFHIIYLNSYLFRLFTVGFFGIIIFETLSDIKYEHLFQSDSNICSSHCRSLTSSIRLNLRWFQSLTLSLSNYTQYSIYEKYITTKT